MITIKEEYALLKTGRNENFDLLTRKTNYLYKIRSFELSDLRSCCKVINEQK